MVTIATHISKMSNTRCYGYHGNASEASKIILYITILLNHSKNISGELHGPNSKTLREDRFLRSKNLDLR